jgi:hypothetical protein
MARILQSAPLALAERRFDFLNRELHAIVTLRIEMIALVGQNPQNVIDHRFAIIGMDLRGMRDARNVGAKIAHQPVEPIERGLRALGILRSLAIMRAERLVGHVEDLAVNAPEKAGVVAVAVITPLRPSAKAPNALHRVTLALVARLRADAGRADPNLIRAERTNRATNALAARALAANNRSEDRDHDRHTARVAPNLTNPDLLTGSQRRSRGLAGEREPRKEQNIADRASEHFARLRAMRIVLGFRGVRAMRSLRPRLRLSRSISRGLRSRAQILLRVLSAQFLRSLREERIVIKAMLGADLARAKSRVKRLGLASRGMRDDLKELYHFGGEVRHGSFALSAPSAARREKIRIDLIMNRDQD